MLKINWNTVRCCGHYSRPIRTLDTLNNPADMAATVARDGYAWPGGYELVIVTDDGGVLCHDCVRSEYGQIYREAISRERGCGWKPAAVGAIGCNIDDAEALYCDNCDKVLCEGAEAEGADNE